LSCWINRHVARLVRRSTASSRKARKSSKSTKALPLSMPDWLWPRKRSNTTRWPVMAH
jgi:hypothetical protein